MVGFKVHSIGSSYGWNAVTALLSIIALTTLAAVASVDIIAEVALEKDILVAFYHATSGESWTRQSGWLSDPVHHCEWEGVACISLDTTARTRARGLQEDTRSIQMIDLSENNLRGSVPLSLLLFLPNIKSIKINGNNVDYTKIAEQEQEVLGQVLDNLSAPISSTIRRLDLSHTTVSSLERIFRAGNGDTIINTPNLRDLHASQAQIRGSFPSFIFDVTTIERLSLDHNSLTGTIPNTLGNCERFKYLSLGDNSLQGTIPEEFNRLNKVRYVLLGGNRLTGTIPNGLTSFEYTPLLEQLDVSDQRPAHTSPIEGLGLIGPLPPFSTHKFLRRLDLGLNSFTGSVPENLLQATEKDGFDFAIFSSNDLTGTIPHGLIDQFPEETLFLANNRISDLNRPECSSLEFGCNSFLCPPGSFEPRSGRKDEEARPCLNCQQNTLYWGQTKCKVSEPQGPTLPPPPTAAPTPPPVPQGFSERAALLEFFIATSGQSWKNKEGWEENNPDICSWYGVQCKISGGDTVIDGLHLDNNGLMGTTPEILFDLPHLSFLAMNHNEGLVFNFKGIDRASHLRALDLSSTKMGNLADIGGSAETLEELFFSDMANFVGESIPTVILTLRNLKQLTLNYNGMVGSLPDDIGNLSNLITFSVVNNALTGSLPPSISSMSSLATLRLSSNHMSGSLPAGLESLSALTILDLSNQWSNGDDDDFDNTGHSGFTGTIPAFTGFKQLRRLSLAVNSFHGTIPTNFLADVDRSNEGLFEYVDLSENFFQGIVPSEMANLREIYLQDNDFTGIDPFLCDSQTAELLQFGCDAVLCKPGTYNSNGRATSVTSVCESCNSSLTDVAKYYGTVQCEVEVDIGGLSSASEDGFSEDQIVREVLEQIYNFCEGYSWSVADGWMDDNRQYCTWEGIRCDAKGLVVAIALRSNNLVGTFPSDKVFRGISSLESLDIDGNSITFSFEGIASAENLRILDLSHTNLDSIQGIGAAPGLASLFLSSNNLRGAFHSEILQLKALTRLALDLNSITGTIPAALSTLVDLELLALHDNKMTGTIPAEIAQLTDLFFLLLQSNSLSGSIPDALSSLSSVRFLNLASQDGDGLTGTLPSLSNLQFLKRLDLSNNNLDGAIPSDFLSNTPGDGFEALDLSKNKLSGVVPVALNKFTLRIDIFDLTDNEISGVSPGLCPTIGIFGEYGCDAVLCPDGEYNSKGRQMTDDEKCQPCLENVFFGSTTCGNVTSPTAAPTVVPNPNQESSNFAILTSIYDALNGVSWTKQDNWKESTVSTCAWYGISCADGNDGNIVSIQLSGNNLVGTVPSEIFQLPALKSIILDLNNDMQFTFDGIGSAKQLEAIDVSSTNTKSVQGIEDAKGLKELHLLANTMRGTIESAFFNLNSLEQLSIGFNELSGGLDTNIGKLTNLKLLSCEGNYLSGTLPESLGGLTNLLTLRAGKNTFTGAIPDAMKELTSLVILDLSHQTENNGRGLSGPLPSFESLSNLQQIDLGHNILSGTIPALFLDKVDSNMFDFAILSSNKITGIIPASMASHGNIHFQDNEISALSMELCEAKRGQLYASYGCDAVLCPPGTYNSKGRQESDVLKCQPCAEALFFGSTICPKTALDGSATDREILTYFYQKCGGDDWDESTHWLNPNRSICEWHGIKCVEGSDEEFVESIELGANNLVGFPPKQLFHLSSLKVLSLYSNPLDGFSFDGIHLATQLEDLILDAIGLRSIHGVGKATNLKRLNVRFNALRGHFPDEMKELTKLENLMLSYNEFTGTMPTFLEDMTSLYSLLLTSNHFSGHLKGVNMPSTIRFLDISQNDLTGTIPDSFLTLIPFQAALEVDLSDNLLTGAIPTDLIRFEHLNLYLGNNKITEIDLELCTKQFWNDGDVGTYGCDGLICPAGYHALNGRQKTDSAPCQKCNNLPYMGLEACDSNSAAAASRVQGIVISLMVTLAMYALNF